ncbi:universal stress protein [Neorhizobium sp. JUb45]|uniref:universal stress protein n=1 Tax=unclassified Neorhizobium TaxID=2629175 RepID=UPI00104438BA|nr:universal stress protein [Neorhizobium sp. JUb45]TCR02651.1 nucleotide-binding universal stress UspA family protein [Neorhizobium sp. JUb45]
MYERIIVAIDTAQLDKAERILRRAMRMVAPGGALVLVNAVEDVPSYISVADPIDLTVAARKAADETLTALCERLGVNAQIEIRQGAAAREILASAEQNAADLILIASHVPDVSNYFIGATADRVVRHARCSVLIDR